MYQVTQYNPSTANHERVGEVVEDYSQAWYIALEAVDTAPDCEVEIDILDNKGIYIRTVTRDLGNMAFEDRKRHLMDRIKQKAFELGQYMVPVPDVCTRDWGRKDWIKYIDLRGAWLCLLPSHRHYMKP